VLSRLYITFLKKIFFDPGMFPGERPGKVSVTSPAKKFSFRASISYPEKSRTYSNVATKSGLYWYA
jgi:hypothetical protein